MYACSRACCAFAAFKRGRVVRHGHQLNALTVSLGVGLGLEGTDVLIAACFEQR